MSRTCLVLFVLFVVLPLPALASDPPGATGQPVVAAAVVNERPESTHRPAGLIGLYIVAATLQTYDVYSTLAPHSGAVELNPVMKQVVGNPALMIAVKATVAATNIAMAEHLWRTNHPMRAVALMVASNSVMAVVDARNARVLHGQR